MTSMMASMIVAAGLMFSNVAVASVEEAIELLDKNNCRGCHKVDGKMVGPCYTKVATKYKDNPYAMSILAYKDTNGGKGVWGRMPMPENTNITNPREIKVMLDYIMSFAQ